MSEEFLYPEFETKWSNSEIIDMLFDWAKFCMKNKTGDLSNDTAEYFSDKLKAKIAVCSPNTPPTIEEAELWKQVAADISGATSYITIEVAKGDWKTAQDIVNKLYASLQQKYSLSRRSEQNTDLPIEEIKKKFAGYINWCGNGLKPDIVQLDNLFRYLRKSGCVLTQNGFKWGGKQNSEAVDQDDEEDDLYSAVGKAREEHELREFLSEAALERADFVKVITKFFPHERSPADPKERNIYLNIRVAAENILILYDQMVERLKQKQ